MAAFLRPSSNAIRGAAGSEASRVPWPKSESLADIALRSLPPAFGVASLQDRPFRYGFSWAVSKAGDFAGPPFSIIRLKVPGGANK